MQLGIVGLGRMGGNMAQRLLQGGHDLVVYDPNPEAVEAQASAGAAGAASLPELVAALDAPRGRVVYGAVGRCYRGDHRGARERDGTRRYHRRRGERQLQGLHPQGRDTGREGRQPSRRRHERRDLGPRRGVQPHGRGATATPSTGWSRSSRPSLRALTRATAMSVGRERATS